jgi:hypothetical protein
MLERAAESEDPHLRVVLSSVFMLAQYAQQQFRLKKPFNPILNETYEFVQPNYKFMSEQVSHHPPITAFSYEGKGFKAQGNSHIIQTFKLGNGAGRLLFEQPSCQTFMFEDKNDIIQVMKPNLIISNIVMGTTNMDMGGQV